MQANFKKAFFLMGSIKIFSVQCSLSWLCAELSFFSTVETIECLLDWDFARKMNVWKDELGFLGCPEMYLFVTFDHRE